MKKFLVTIIAVAMLLSIASIGAFASDLPQANLEVLPAKVLTEADEYFVYKKFDTAESDLSDTKDRPLNVVVEFSAIDTEETVKTSPYKDWYVDFFLTFKGLSDKSFIAKDCYLAGNYGEYGWYVIPTDALKIEDGVQYPVVSAVLAPLTYETICTDVKDIICALYLDDAIIEANPNIEVVLELGIWNPENSNDIVIVNSSTYDADRLAGYVARIGDEKFSSLQTAFDKGGNIVLIDDIVVDKMIKVEGNNPTTLDLNGHTITAGNLTTNNFVIWVTTGDDVTINDSVGGGGIVNNTSGGYAVLNQGTLTVNDGTFVGDMALWNGYDTINSIATINGGTFSYNNDEEEGYSVGNSGTMIIKAGATINDWIETFGSLTVTGGNIENIYAYSGEASLAESTTTITGGSIGVLDVEKDTANVVSVSGGTFKEVPATTLLSDGFEAVLNAEGAYEIDTETDVPATIEAAKNEDGSASVAINAGFDNYAATVEETKTFGVYIYKSGTKTGKKVMFKEGEGSLVATEGLFNVVVTDIPETEFNTVLVCVPFVVVGEETMLGNAKAITAGSLLGLN